MTRPPQGHSAPEFCRFGPHILPMFQKCAPVSGPSDFCARHPAVASDAIYERAAPGPRRRG